MPFKHKVFDQQIVPIWGGMVMVLNEVSIIVTVPAPFHHDITGTKYYWNQLSTFYKYFLLYKKSHI